MPSKVKHKSILSLSSLNIKLSKREESGNPILNLKLLIRKSLLPALGKDAFENQSSWANKAKKEGKWELCSVFPYANSPVLTRLLLFIIYAIFNSFLPLSVVSAFAPTTGSSPSSSLGLSLGRFRF